MSQAYPMTCKTVILVCLLTRYSITALFLLSIEIRGNCSFLRILCLRQTLQCNLPPSVHLQKKNLTCEFFLLNARNPGAVTSAGVFTHLYSSISVSSISNTSAASSRLSPSSSGRIRFSSSSSSDRRISSSFRTSSVSSLTER